MKTVQPTELKTRFWHQKCKEIKTVQPMHLKFKTCKWIKKIASNLTNQRVKRSIIYNFCIYIQSSLSSIHYTVGGAIIIYHPFEFNFQLFNFAIQSRYLCACTSRCNGTPHLGRVGGVGRFARHFNESSLEICPKRYPPLRDVLVITTSCVCSRILYVLYSVIDG